jgi:hypothetical protein
MVTPKIEPRLASVHGLLAGPLYFGGVLFVNGSIVFVPLRSNTVSTLFCTFGSFLHAVTAAIFAGPKPSYRGAFEQQIPAPHAVWYPHFGDSMHCLNVQQVFISSLCRLISKQNFPMLAPEIVTVSGCDVAFGSRLTAK